LSTVEEYDPETNTWTTKSPMPTARQAFSASVVNGKIYAIGGGDVSALPTVEEYDPVNDNWNTTKTDMPTARFDHSAIVLDGKIYLIGGSDSHPQTGNAILTVDIYDPASDTWTQNVDTIPERIAAGFAILVDGKIYAFGGYDDLEKVLEYDPVTDTWTRKIDMPTKRAGLSGSVLDGKIYAIGGHPGSSPYQALSTVEVYDPWTDTWKTATNMLTGKCGLGTSVVNGKIYAIGGYTGESWLSSICMTVEEYDPSKDPLLGVERNDSKLPQKFALQQNYPNPFNPNSIIEFSIPKTEFVTLKVYNILGEEVATLVSERLAAGSYTYDWDAAGLASGLYLYRLEAGYFVKMRKMVLMR
jgi:N-acetylneuraminic acid mutarotase